MSSLIAPMRFCVFPELSPRRPLPLKTISHSKHKIPIHDLLILWFVNGYRLINTCQNHITFGVHLSVGGTGWLITCYAIKLFCIHIQCLTVYYKNRVTVKFIIFRADVIHCSYNVYNILQREAFFEFPDFSIPFLSILFTREKHPLPNRKVGPVRETKLTMNTPIINNDQKKKHSTR